MECNDIFESVSSGIDGKETPENGGMEEISNELHRRCQLYEEELRNGKTHVSHLEVSFLYYINEIKIHQSCI